MTIKTKSRILEAVHESASDLHRLGFIDKRKMQKYDALCIFRSREASVPIHVSPPFRTMGSQWRVPGGRGG